MYVPDFIIAKKEYIEQNSGDIDEIKQEKALGYMLLLVIDYTYHHNDEDYDGGLSFIDRINDKLGDYHPEWDIVWFKTSIRNAVEPQLCYLQVIEEMLQKEEDRLYYGL